MGAITTRRSGRVGLVLMLALLSGGCAVHLPGQGDHDPGRFSGFTRAELRTIGADATSFPLVVPQVLPDGAGSGDEPGFVLSSVTFDRGVPAARQVWLSYYLVDVLGSPAATFRVFQRRGGEASVRPCGAVDQPFVQRRVGSTTITVCSAALSAGSKARTYWSRVTLTSDLEEVTWLKN